MNNKNLCLILKRLDVYKRQAHMFVIEGVDKVRDVIEKNRKRKLTKHKKLSNNTIIGIDNCSLLEILKLQKNLEQIAEKEQIGFAYRKGCLLYTSRCV